MTAPAVTVLLPFYNAESALAESVESVLSQTFTDFELLLVDDGSTDDSPATAERFARADSRVRIHSRGENRGLAATLNEGIAEARGRFVARMDADDRCLPGRLARQLEYLEDNEEVDMVGAFVEVFGKRRAIWRFPTSDRSIKDMLLVKPSMWHPLYFFRRDRWLEAGIAYDESLSVAQDYDVLTRAARHLRMANIPEVLLEYRQHGGQVSETRRAVRMENSAKTAVAYLARRFPETTPREQELHYRIVSEAGARTSAELEESLDWLNRLLGSTDSSEPDVAMVHRALSRKAYYLCRRSTHLGPSALSRYLRSRFLRYHRPPVSSLARFAALAALHHGSVSEAAQ